MKQHTSQDTEVIKSPLAKTEGIWCNKCNAFVPQAEHMPPSNEYYEMLSDEAKARLLVGEVKRSLKK